MELPLDMRLRPLKLNDPRDKYLPSLVCNIPMPGMDIRQPNMAPCVLEIKLLDSDGKEIWMEIPFAIDPLSVIEIASRRK